MAGIINPWSNLKYFLIAYTSIWVTGWIFAFFLVGFFLFIFFVINLHFIVLNLTLFLHFVQHRILKLGWNVKFFKVSSVRFLLSFRFWAFLRLMWRNWASIARLRPWIFLLFLIFIIALQKSQIVFKYTFMRNRDSILLHALLYFLHMVLNRVFCFEVIFQLFKYFEDEFLFFFQGFLCTQLLILIFSFYLLHKVFVNVLAQVVFLIGVLAKVSEFIFELLKRSLFCHFKLFFFKVLLNIIF